MSRADRPRICLTPGSAYGVGVDHAGNVLLTVKMPRAVDGERVRQYIFGHFGVTTKGTADATKLERYEQMYAERARISKSFHDALEPVIGDLYRTIWPLAVAGRTIDGEVMPDAYDEYLTGGVADKLFHLLKNAPRDGTYIEVTTGSAIVRNVYWCDQASAWAEGGRTFLPPLPPTATWKLMDEPVDADR